MAKKYNADDVFKNFMTVERNEDRTVPMTENRHVLQEKEESFSHRTIESTVDPKESKLKQRSYYLTDELLKAITIKTSEGMLDKSGVVRESLALYLADILNNKN